MTEYLKKLPRTLIEDIVSGNCIPFLGAGFSKNADVSNGQGIPDWQGLSAEVSKYLEGYSATTPLDCLSAFSHSYSRTRLIELTRDILLIEKARPGQAHNSFCRLPFNIVCTTNFDFLLEKGYEMERKSYVPIIEESQLGLNAGEDLVRIVKMHGDLNHPAKIVITEEDYDGFIEQNPLMCTYITNLLITKTALFIGYSLDDPDFRQLWQTIKSRLGKLRRQAYVLLVDASEADVARFARRGVHVVSLPGKKKDYGAIYANLFAELCKHWLEKVSQESVVSDEEKAIQFKSSHIKSESLCFVSLPIERLSWYKSRVFPIIEEYGFLPISGDEVIVFGDNIQAKIASLIEKCSIMMVDASSKFAISEFRQAVNKPDLDIFVIGDMSMSENFKNRDNLKWFVPVSLDFIDDKGEFIFQIREWLGKMKVKHFVDNSKSYERLYKNKEYKYAVLDAYIQLEKIMREKIKGSEGALTRQNLNLMFSISEIIGNSGIVGLSGDDLTRIKEIQKIRNKIVHDNEEMSMVRARDIIDAIERIINILTERR